MTEGDVVLARLPQVDGTVKLRPAVLLCIMPPFNDFLICGVSTQLHQSAVNFDEQIGPIDSDFAASGLKSVSLIRLGYLAVLPVGQLKGRIGRISTSRLIRLRTTLADHLRP